MDGFLQMKWVIVLCQVQFLVIQHSNLETQKKLEPLIKKGVADCQLPFESYYLLLDRILVKSERNKFMERKYFSIQKKVAMSPM